MTRWIATLLLVVLVGWVGLVSAQQQPYATPPAGQAPGAPAAMVEKTMEGKVKAVDQANKQITLEDDSVLTIPATVQVSWAELQPGKTVAVSYIETGEAGQQKAVKKIELK